MGDVEFLQGLDPGEAGGTDAALAAVGLMGARARTEFGEDPGTARVRPAAEVEEYES